MRDIFKLGKALPPWGGYGGILVHGMSAHLGRDSEGRIRLERTGPFVPPISLPGIDDIVVTDDFRERLEKSALAGVTFAPVVKARIVFLEWEKWDQNTTEPPEYPDSGEPEDYVLDRPHDRDLARRIGTLWEVRLGVHAKLQRFLGGPKSWNAEFEIVDSSWDGTDVFRAEGARFNFASGRAKAWLEQEAGRWVSFESVSGLRFGRLDI